MKNIVFILCLISYIAATAQVDSDTDETTKFELGSGLTLNFNDGDYLFKLGGMMQPYIGMNVPENGESGFLLNSKRTYFNFSGKAAKEKIDFLFQTDFSLASPLLDAWVGYSPMPGFNIRFGQQQNIGNNREMLLIEDHLQFANRSLLSTSFANTGREFGVTISQKTTLAGIGIHPQVAVTSGDGRNSFGANSRDVDLGGLKYAARLDVLPLGFFTQGNEKQIADLANEPLPKFVLGAAASLNDGASHRTGEGHGEFYLYNRLKQNQLPDYRKILVDFLFKFKGVSILAEYNIATAAGLQGAITDTSSGNLLIPQQISDFLVLGNGYNVQMGYVVKKGFGVDIRLSSVSQEFKNRTSSALQDQRNYTIGLTKYIKENNLKLHAAYTASASKTLGNSSLADLMVQIIF